MRETLRQRHEDPDKRSLDRQHWREDDERDRIQRRRFRIHLFFDVLLVAASAWLAMRFHAERVEGKVAELRSEVTRLEKKLSTKDRQLSALMK